MSAWQDPILFGKQTDPQSGTMIVSGAEETNKSIRFNSRVSGTSLQRSQQQECRREDSGSSTSPGRHVRNTGGEKETFTGIILIFRCFTSVSSEVKTKYLDLKEAKMKLHDFFFFVH